jgi:hypothetical protein
MTPIVVFPFVEMITFRCHTPFTLIFCAVPPTTIPHFSYLFSLYCTLLYVVVFVVEAKRSPFGSPSPNLTFMFMYDD